MKRFLLFLATLVCVPAILAQQNEQCNQIKLAGTLKAGESFRREIGNGLTFRIDPWKESAGWEFEIGPTSPDPDEWDQYIYVLTPPYRSTSAREVNTGWGVTAQDVITVKREFWFLISRKDAPAASNAIDSVLWPKSEQAQKQALQELASLPAGAGKFKILDSKITPSTALGGESDCQDGRCGEIHWIQFQVALNVPASFLPAKDLEVHPVKCPNHSDSPLTQLASPHSR